MKQFLKYFVASTFGVVAGLFLLFFILIGIGSSIANKAASEKDLEVKPNSILKVSLNFPIDERATQDPFANFSFQDFEPKKAPGLFEIRKAIKKAKSDDNIKGIYIDAASVNAGSATVDAIRDALLDFKTSGKFIVAYQEVMTQKAFYLASVADQIYINPVGLLEFKGYRTELAFFKNALDKLEVKPQIFYAGKYKSATEPFRLEKMSDANREQINFLITDLYGRFLEGISEERGVSSMMLDSIANNLLVKFPEEAKAYKLIDELGYYDEVQALLKEKAGLEEDDDLELVSLKKYAFKKAAKAEEKETSKDKVAVLFAQGSIVDGEGELDEIGSGRFLKAIQKIRKDEDIKALVLRVNSGGGSALASDVILRELELANEKMPVIVSMGDVAASGGYYISAGADTILAEENTVTGSIGVFGIIPNIQGLMNKLGITFDRVKTGKYADLGSVTREMRADEKEIIQQGVDRVYLTFKERVAEGRGMTVEYVDSVGQGRVWTGVQAKNLGLVDVLGGLDDALKIAVNKAGIESYEVKQYPETKDFKEQLMKSLTGEVKMRIFKTLAAEEYELYQKLEELKKWKGAQARLPFEIEVY